MFLDEIKLIDVVLEGLKVIGMVFLLFTLNRAAQRYPSLATSRWKAIITGFIMMLVGFTFDFSDEIINYEASPLLETIQACIEEIGLIGGLFLVTFGFNRWFNFVSRFLGIAPKTGRY